MRHKTTVGRRNGIMTVLSAVLLAIGVLVLVAWIASLLT